MTAAAPTTTSRADERATAAAPPRLRTVQWALRVTLGLALLVSMAANMLHARPDPTAQSIAAWSPLALFTAIEVMTRVPVRDRTRAAIRIVATTAIAAIAAIASYQHMLGVVTRYGETGPVAVLLPASVDGLVAVLSVSLFDIAQQLRTAGPTAEPDPDTPATPPTNPHGPTRPAANPASGGAPTPPARRPTSDRQPDPAPRADTDPRPDPRTAPPRRRTGSTGATAAARTRPSTTAAARTTTSQPGGTVADRNQPSELPAALVPLLEPAAQAYQTLLDRGEPITRDTLATTIRDQGQPIRSANVAPLLALLRHTPHRDQQPP